MAGADRLSPCSHLTIAGGRFSFAPATLGYVGKGVGSWQREALGTHEKSDDKDSVFRCDTGFLETNWKLFRDALQAHRFCVLHVILPRYGICAA